MSAARTILKAVVGGLVGAAIAGCGRSDWRSDEISPGTYRLLESGSNDRQQAQLLHRFMADGKITYGELSQWNDFNERRAEPIADVKRKLAEQGE